MMQRAVSKRSTSAGWTGLVMKFAALALVLLGFLSMSSSFTSINETLREHRVFKERGVDMPHVAVVYDRFPGEFEGNDEYVFKIMSVLRGWNWKTTLITLLQGQGMQIDYYPTIKKMGIDVVMISGATVTTSRGELGAALETLPKVDSFLVVQTFRNKQIVSPVAILRPFLRHANAVFFSSDTHTFRTHTITEAQKALDSGLPISMDFKNTSWVPTANMAQRLSINEVLELSSTEKKSLEVADRFYFTSEEDLENSMHLFCGRQETCDPSKVINQRKIFNIGNPRTVVTDVPTWSQRKRIIFIGGESEINALNLRFFVERVLPKIRVKIPYVEVDVLSPQCVHIPDVFCRDWKSSTDEAFDSALLMAYPALAGTGLHLKNWMALSRGVPIVTTPFGSIGFPNEKAGIVVADNAVTFAEEAIRIIQDERRWQELSKAALGHALSAGQNAAEESLVSLSEMVAYQRPQTQQAFLAETDLVTIEQGIPTIKAPPFIFRTSDDIKDMPTTTQVRGADLEITRTKCDTAPPWAGWNDLRFAVLYWHNPSQFFHYDRDVFHMLQHLVSLKYPVTVITLMPIARAMVTNEQILRAIGVHFVHLDDAKNADATRRELEAVAACLKFNVLISVPEYSYGSHQKLYIDVKNVLDEMPTYQRLPRVLLMPSVFSLSLPYDKALQTANFMNRSQKKLSTFSSPFDESKILSEYTPAYERLYWYERKDAKTSDIVLFTADVYRNKAQNIWCGDWYKSRVKEQEGECFASSKTYVMQETVKQADILSKDGNAYPDERYIIAFFGSGSERNIEGITWFIQSVLPTVRAAIPKAEMHLSGPICFYLNQPVTREAFDQVKHVSCNAVVTEAQFNFNARHTRLFVNPMLSGLDSNTRMLGPMKSGVPVVTTKVGAVGFGEGSHLSIANSAQEFSDHIIRLFRYGPFRSQKPFCTISWVQANTSFLMMQGF